MPYRFGKRIEVTEPHWDKYYPRYFIQSLPDGSVLASHSNPSDSGQFQVNRYERHRPIKIVLKTCKFCGGVPEIIDTKRPGYCDMFLRTRCSWCVASTGPHMDEEVVAESWNGMMG